MAFRRTLWARGWPRSSDTAPPADRRRSRPLPPSATGRPAVTNWLGFIAVMCKLPSEVGTPIVSNPACNEVQLSCSLHGERAPARVAAPRRQFDGLILRDVNRGGMLPA